MRHELPFTEWWNEAIAHLNTYDHDGWSTRTTCTGAQLTPDGMDHARAEHANNVEPEDYAARVLVPAVEALLKTKMRPRKSGAVYLTR